jgi:hypothetical protein
MAILDTFRELKAGITLEHIEAHQDTQYPNRPPTWPAILNTRCDAIASDKLALATDVLRKVPFLPANKISLEVQGVSTTHHLPSPLRRSSNSVALRAYLYKLIISGTAQSLIPLVGTPYSLRLSRNPS